MRYHHNRIGVLDEQGYLYCRACWEDETQHPLLEQLDCADSCTTIQPDTAPHNAECCDSCGRELILEARELRRGDRFFVLDGSRRHVDPEGAYRVCLESHEGFSVRWGVPDNREFWSFMGSACRVVLLSRNR